LLLFSVALMICSRALKSTDTPFRYHVFTFQTLSDVDSQALPSEAIHHREHAQFSAVKQVVGY